MTTPPTIYARMAQIRRTAAQWAALNPILYAGELILVDQGDGTYRPKVGIANTRYADTGYNLVLSPAVHDNDLHAETYLTEEAADSLYAAIGAYLSQEAADLLYAPISHNNDNHSEAYLTETAADLLYQAIGSYLTQEAADIRYAPIALGLTADTTVNLNSSMTTAQIQAAIDAQPKNLNGKTLTFQFADGTYAITSALTFSRFANGLLRIYGNAGDNTLSTTKAVIIQQQTADTDVISLSECGLCDVNYLHLYAPATAGGGRRVRATRCVAAQIAYCYLQSNSRAYQSDDLAYFIQTPGTVSYTYGEYGYMGIRSDTCCFVLAKDNAVTANKPYHAHFAGNNSRLARTGTSMSGSQTSTYADSISQCL